MVSFLVVGKFVFWCVSARYCIRSQDRSSSAKNQVAHFADSCSFLIAHWWSLPNDRTFWTKSFVDNRSRMNVRWLSFRIWMHWRSLNNDRPFRIQLFVDDRSRINVCWLSLCSRKCRWSFNSGHSFRIPSFVDDRMSVLWLSFRVFAFSLVCSGEVQDLKGSQSLKRKLVDLSLVASINALFVPHARLMFCFSIVLPRPILI